MLYLASDHKTFGECLVSGFVRSPSCPTEWAIYCYTRFNETGLDERYPRTGSATNSPPSLSTNLKSPHNQTET